MTINDINSKVNLPAYCEIKGLTGYQFKKVPKFGWFAYTKNYDEVKSLFDFIPRNELLDELTYIIKEKKNIHDFRMLYSETYMGAILKDYGRYILINKLHKEAEALYNETKALVNGVSVNLRDELVAAGQGKFLQVRPGLLNKTLIDSSQFRSLGIPTRGINRTLIPTYCSPKHICSLEYCKHGDIVNRTTLYLNEEAGWVGTSLEGTVCGDARTLQWKDGFVWEKKADIWTNKVVDIDAKMSVADCLRIWREAQNTMFRTSPLDVIEVNKKEGEIKQHIRELSQGQIAQLEKRFGIEFLNIWKNLNFQEVYLGRVKFIQKDSHYYMQVGEAVDEFTNFTVTIERIIKRGSAYYRAGYISYEDNIVPFELENHHFLSSKGLVRKLCEVFFDHGIGIPVVYNAYQSFLIDVVNRFNRNVKIEVEN